MCEENCPECMKLFVFFNYSTTFIDFFENTNYCFDMRFLKTVFLKCPLLSPLVSFLFNFIFSYLFLLCNRETIIKHKASFVNC